VTSPPFHPTCRIRLDGAVTTPPLPEVIAAMRPFLESDPAVPALIHSDGLRARDALTTARTQAATLVNAEAPESIVFTSSGTEAINLALKGLAWSPRRRGQHLVVTSLDHPAVLKAAAFLQQHGYRVTTVAPDPTGRIDPQAVQKTLEPDTFLVCLPQASHDLGTLQLVAEIGALTAEHDIPLLVDATSSGGWVPLDVQVAHASLVTLAPHRFHGPPGVGILYRHRSMRLEPLLHGGDQEHGLRAGTENLPAIVGAGVAAESAASHLAERASHAATLQHRLWTQLQNRIDHIQLNGPPPGPLRAPHLLHVTVENVEAEALILMLDLQGIALHGSTACLTRSFRLPPALQAIGLTPAQVRSSLLFGLHATTTLDDIDHAVDRLAAAVNKLRSLSAG
jgi:cysteine desulfurase